MPSDDVLVLIDEGGRVIEWGRPAEERFGRSSEEAVGRPVTALVREVATAGNSPRSGCPDSAAVLVKPVLRGTAVVWQVLAARDSMPGQDVAILEAMFAHSPVALLILDDQLRVVRVSTTSGILRDAPAEHLLGRSFIEVSAFGDPEEEAAVAQRVLVGGEPVANRLVRGILGPGRPRCRTHSVSYFRLEDSHGDVLGLVASAVDVTERENATSRLALLDHVRASVGHLLNVGIICQELADAVVPAFAAMAVVEVVDDVVRGEDPPAVPVRPDVPLRRAAFQGGHPAYPIGEVRPLPPGAPFSNILSDLRPLLLPIDENSSWLAADPSRADAVRRSGAHSVIVAPLALCGQALGLASFYRQQDQAPFDEEDIAVASAVCAHTALCIENARRFMREWTIASTVQRRLLPQHPVRQTTVEASPLHLSDPAGGGAWFDVIALPSARTALVVGSVAGQGIAAAITMGLLRTALHTLIALDLQPDELLARLSESVARMVPAYAALPTEAREPDPLRVGCAVAIYDPIELTCTIARAGLPEPVAVLPDGTSAPLPVPPGPLLTGRDDAPFPATTVDLPADTTLAMGTGTLADQLIAPSGPLRPLLDDARTRPLDDLRDTIAHAVADAPPAGETVMLLARTMALSADRPDPGTAGGPRGRTDRPCGGPRTAAGLGRGRGHRVHRRTHRQRVRRQRRPLRGSAPATPPDPGPETDLRGQRRLPQRSAGATRPHHRRERPWAVHHRQPRRSVGHPPSGPQEDRLGGTARGRADGRPMTPTSHGRISLTGR
uniref:SpoIIE family protein phosphatase n=1 Tax=Peterkaempfera podocarpi TaxID=3232308 RepID=UPI003F5551DD